MIGGGASEASVFTQSCNVATQALAEDHAAQLIEGASSPQDDVVECSFCEKKFCREPLACCWHCGAKLCDQRCFQAHILVCSLRTLPREAVVTYLEPAPALFAEACARKGVLTVAHPPGSLAQRDLRADGRLRPCPLARFSRTCSWKVWSPISVWFKWVQDIDIGRAAQHGFLGAVSCHESGFAARHCGNGCTWCLPLAPTTNTGALFCHIEANFGVSQSLQKRSIEVSWCGPLCAPLTARGICQTLSSSSTLVAYYTRG